jgi:hypothetical protein
MKSGHQDADYLSGAPLLNFMEVWKTCLFMHSLFLLMMTSTMFERHYQKKVQMHTGALDKSNNLDDWDRAESMEASMCS